MKVEIACAQCVRINTRKRCAGVNPAMSFCDNQCKAAWQRTQKPATREWLYQKYIIDGLHASQIAELVSRNEKRVWEWLRDYEIPTRPRGSNEAMHFQKGQVGTFLGRSHTPETRQKIREARERDGGVPYLQDGVHHLKGKRGPATPNWKGGITPERQTVYSSTAWKEAVKVVWRRDDARCRKCGLDHRTVDRKTVKFAVHHIVSFANRVLRCEPSNLVLLCRTCHLWVHSNDNTRKEFITP